MIGLKIHSSLLYYIWWTPTLIGGNCISKFLGTVSQNKNKKKSSGPDNQTYEGDLEEKEKNYEQEFNILCIKSSVPFKPFKPFKPLYNKNVYNTYSNVQPRTFVNMSNLKKPNKISSKKI